jgi:hypothetical protein
LSDPLDPHLKHFIDDSLLLGICSLDELGCPEVTKVVVDPRKFIFPSFCGDLIVEIKLDIGDHSKWIRVKRDSALCELHNRDVDIFCGWPNFKKKSCVFVSHIDLLPVLVQDLFLFGVRPNPIFEY